MTIDMHGETATLDEYRAARDNVNGMLDHLQKADRSAFIARVFKALSPEDRKTAADENWWKSRQADMGRLD